MSVLPRFALSRLVAVCVFAATTASAADIDDAPVSVAAAENHSPQATAPMTAGPGQPATTATSSQAKPIVHDGQTFNLARTSANASVETDEYITAGEKLGEWTQLVTVQRLTLAKPSSTKAFLTYFKTRVAEDGATLEVLAEAKAAAVFAVRFPQSDRNDEQVMICLAFGDPGRRELLNIVQYAIKPTKCPVDLAARRIRSWRDKFLAQAKTMDATSS